MQHGIIRTRAEGRVTDNRSKSRFIGTEHKADRHKTISIKFIIIVWSTTGKYGKLTHEITLSVVFVSFLSVLT